MLYYPPVKLKHILCAMSTGLILWSVHDRDYYLALMGCLCLVASVYYEG